MTESTPEPTPESDSAVPAAPFGPPYQPGTIRLGLVVHVDVDSLWVEVPTLPGLFATGATVAELGAALGEATQAYLTAESTRDARTATDATDATDEIGE